MLAKVVFKDVSWSLSDTEGSEERAVGALASVWGSDSGINVVSVLPVVP